MAVEYCSTPFIQVAGPAMISTRNALACHPNELKARRRHRALAILMYGSVKINVTAISNTSLIDDGVPPQRYPLVSFALVSFDYGLNLLL